MIHESGTLMLGQYFRKKRNLVEVFYVSSSGLGMTVVPWVVDQFFR